MRPRARRGQRRFEQKTRIRGLALRRPVPARELERLAWPVEQMQGEARLLSKMHAVAAAARRIEAGLQQRDVLAERRGAEPSLGQSQAEQQRVDPALVLEELEDLTRPILVKKEVGVGAQQIRIAPLERQRIAEVPLGRSDIAQLLRKFAENGVRPNLEYGLGAGRSAQGVLQQAIAVARPASQAASAGGAGGFDQNLDTAGQLGAALQRLGRFALHAEDRGLGQAALGGVGAGAPARAPDRRARHRSRGDAARASRAR